MSFKPGDRVRITCSSGDVSQNGRAFINKWQGYESTVINRDFDSGTYTWLDGVNRPDMVGDREFQWPTSDLELIDQPSTVDDLRRVVSSLRDQGYTVEVKVERTITEAVEV